MEISLSPRLSARQFLPCNIPHNTKGWFPDGPFLVPSETRSASLPVFSLHNWHHEHHQPPPEGSLRRVRAVGRLSVPKPGGLAIRCFS